MVPFQTSWFGSTLQAQMEMKVTSSHPPADVPAILPALIRAIEMADGSPDFHLVVVDPWAIRSFWLVGVGYQHVLP